MDRTDWIYLYFKSCKTLSYDLRIRSVCMCTRGNGADGMCAPVWRVQFTHTLVNNISKRVRVCVSYTSDARHESSNAFSFRLMFSSALGKCCHLIALTFYVHAVSYNMLLRRCKRRAKISFRTLKRYAVITHMLQRKYDLAR